MGLAAFGAVAALGIAACGGGSSSPSSSSGSSSGAGFNAGVTKVVNPSNKKTSGTINFGLSSTPDSTDPGNTYYAFMWNFTRLYTMPLMTYKSCPGSCGLQVVPDLATGPGVVTDNGLTWTYHIQPDVHFEDGTLVTSADVKYAVERTFDVFFIFVTVLRNLRPGVNQPAQNRLLAHDLCIIRGRSRGLHRIHQRAQV